MHRRGDGRADIPEADEGRRRVLRVDTGLGKHAAGIKDSENKRAQGARRRHQRQHTAEVHATTGIREKPRGDHTAGGIRQEKERAAAADATLASGELAYKLIDGFYQTIGTDAYPTTEFTKPSVSYVGDAGYATMYDTTTGYTLNGDVKTYAAVLSGTRLALTEVENVPESTPVVLKGTYYNKLAADLPAINIANDLKGTDVDTAADGTMYILANGADGVGFYKAEGTIPAGKAYFQSTSGVKAFFFDGDDATGISNVDANLNANDAIYNIAGQRVQKMQKGINIINGKKVLF